MKKLDLAHDPLSIFHGSRTPPALYARQKWMNQSHTQTWRDDFKTTVGNLRQDRGYDGLWQGSSLETIRRLFGLHLTVRDADESIRESLHRLLDMAEKSVAKQDDKTFSAETLHDLPFTLCGTADVILPATLFLATIFGLASDPRVNRLYACMAERIHTVTAIEALDPAAVHNMFRALVVHSEYAKGHPVTIAVVQWYADHQRTDGTWGAKIPFYQALNALAHLDPAMSGNMCQKAIEKIAKTQNADGSWGENDSEWCTFLVLHALRNHQFLY